MQEFFASNGAPERRSYKNLSCYEALLFSLENSRRNGSNPANIRRSTSLEKHILSLLFLLLAPLPPPSAGCWRQQMHSQDRASRSTKKEGREGVGGCRTIDRERVDGKSVADSINSPVRRKEIRERVRASSARVFRSTRIIRSRRRSVRIGDRNSRNVSIGNRSSTLRYRRATDGAFVYFSSRYTPNERVYDQRDPTSKLPVV